MKASIQKLEGTLIVRAAIVAAGLVVLGLAPLPTTAQETSYLPLGVGNCWLFVSEGDPWPTEIRGMMVTKSYEMQGQRVHCVSDFFLGVAPGTIHLYESGGDTHERYRTETAGVYPWSDLDQPVVIPDFRPDCMHGARGHFGDPDAITVPAGHFDDALTIVYDELPCTDAGPSSEVYARGVGLVQRRVITIAGVRTWSLVYARVDGISIGDPSFIGRWQAGSPKLGRGAGDDGPGAVLNTWGGIKAHYR